MESNETKVDCVGSENDPTMNMKEIDVIGMLIRLDFVSFMPPMKMRTRTISLIFQCF